MSLVFPDSPRRAVIGGKASALLALRHAGLPIPEWFAVPPGKAPAKKKLAAALEKLGPGPYAVRSSAAAEDGLEHSYAGQFESFLAVKASKVAEHLAEVRASAHSPHLAQYCREHNLPDPGEPAVIVQRMIDPSAAGVAFSADPVSGRRAVCVVSAVEGVGDRLVSGEAEGETWRLDDAGQVLEEGTLLTADQARQIGALARRCEAHFGRPQDIEWALDRDGKAWLLQSRPITTLANLPDPDDELCIWDNSNIAESYTGVTTPLTFTFARKAYEHVYRQFCRVMQVPPGRIDRASRVFPRMLGLVRGRVYYNLINWYHILALLPGYNINRRFMEQMMGVKEPMPDEVVERVAEQYRVGKIADTVHLLQTVAGLVWNHLTIPRQIRRFYLRLNRALEPPDRPLDRCSGQELVAHYRRLENELLEKWDAPIINDFLAMIHHGLLRSLCAHWLHDESGTLQNELLLAAGEIISAEPPRRIIEMAEVARSVDGLPAFLADPDRALPEKLAAVKACPQLRDLYHAYLDKFGDRCLEELKLESPNLHHDPSSLLSSIGAMAQRPARQPDRQQEHPPLTPRFANPLQAVFFRWVLRHASNRVRDRENLRFERTRVFGRVRNLVRELGRRLAADDQLDDPLDVFYLELDELLGAYEHTNAGADFRPLVANRKAEFQRYRHTDPPPDRFETRGPLHRHATFTATAAEEDSGGETRQGVGACPGLVRGRVRVVTEPRGARLEAGEILVAQQTDPGWVVLFPAATGLLVERGSLLSHSAIVSREMNLPCVVSLRGLTSWLQNGDQVEFNGATGTVRKLNHEH